MTGSPSALYMLPFDHRASFEHGLFGWAGARSRQQIEQIAATKQVVYAALLRAIDDGVPRDRAALLVRIRPTHGALNWMVDAAAAAQLPRPPTQNHGERR